MISPLTHQIGQDYCSEIIAAANLQRRGRTTSVASFERHPIGYNLSAAYPNPASNYSIINVTVPGIEQARIALYDALGRQVALLADKVFAQGRTSVKMSVSHLLPGIYFYRLESPSIVLSRKLIVVK
jgi:hypothetical protein